MARLSRGAKIQHSAAIHVFAGSLAWLLLPWKKKDENQAKLGATEADCDGGSETKLSQFFSTLDKHTVSKGVKQTVICSGTNDVCVCITNCLTNGRIW